MLRERRLSHPIARRDSVTATETIEGLMCRVVLEQDMFGCYREKSVEVIGEEPDPRRAGVWNANRERCVA